MAVCVSSTPSKEMAEQMGRVIYPLIEESERAKREEADKALLEKENIAEFLVGAAGDLGLLLKIEDESGKLAMRKKQGRNLDFFS